MGKRGPENRDRPLEEADTAVPIAVDATAAAAPSDPAMEATAASAPSDPAMEATAAPIAIDATAAATPSDPAMEATAASDGQAPAGTAAQPGLRGEKFDHFLVIDQLGAGGMGVVLAAYDPDLDRKVAIKVLRAGAAGSSSTEGRSRLLREAQAMARLSHPNVVTVYEVGVAGEQVFIAMEFVDGGTLTRWLRGEERGWRQIVDLFLEAGRGLVAAHAAGLVHRDFKPDNVLIGKDGRVKVSDFGLVGSGGAAAPAASASPAASALSTSLTVTGTVMGTPIYMAPEQHQGRPTDARTDQFSFCVALYEALHGDRPFAGGTYAELKASVLSGQVGEPPAGSAVPAWIRAVLLRGLQVEPSARYPSMDELLEALRRDPTRARRRRRAIAAAAGLAVLVAGGAGYGIWRRNQVETEYCANIAWRWEVARCVGRLDGDSWRHRAASWRLSSRHGKVLRAERVNAYGHLVDGDGREASREFIYGDGGRIQEAVVRDQFGEVIKRYAYSSDLGRMDLRDRNNNPEPEEGTDVSVYFQEYDDRGHVVRQRLANTYGTPRPNAQRVFGYRVTVDDRGLPTEVESFGPDGRPLADRNGTLLQRRTFDHHGNQTRWASHGTDGKPIPGGGGLTIVTSTHDDHGNLREQRYFGPDERPQVDVNGCHGESYELDDRGMWAEATCVDANGAAIANRSGNARVRYRWDGNGDRTEAAYLDARGAPVMVDGAASIRWRFDDSRRPIEMTLLDTAGQPVLGAQGYASWSRAYDAAGHVSEESYFGIAGERVARKDGIAIFRLVHDDRGNRVENSYFGPDGAPTLDENGCAVLRFEDDERGRRREERCFGTDGRPIRNRDGVARTHIEYDDYGNKTQQSYFDPAGNPTVHNDGNASFRMRYDASGNQIESAWHGVDGRLTLNPSGYAVERQRHDDRGNPIEIARFGIDGEPAVDKHGVAITRMTWDAQGRQIAAACFGIDGQPTINRAPGEGWASKKTRFDDRGQMIEERLFDVDGRPTRGAGDWATVVMTHDARGLLVDKAFFGADGRLRDGVAIERYAHDERRNLVLLRWFGADGQPVLHRQGHAALRRTYDAVGRMIEETNLGLDGKPVITWVNGVATVRSSFDALGRAVETIYLGTDGKPMPNNRGVARTTQRYDGLGRQIEGAAFGVDGRPRAWSGEGYARWTATYDDRGNQTGSAYFGEDGNPVLLATGVAAVRSRHDELGRLVERVGLGLDGQPKAWIKEGLARVTRKYDERGNQIEERYFDAAGAPVLASTGIAGWRARHDAGGRVIEREAFGVDGKPKNWDVGYARYTARYDARGDQIESAHFRADGTPGPDPAVTRWTYDSGGRKNSEAYFDAAGKPLLIGGTAVRRWAYDARGRQVQESNHGLDGALAPSAEGWATIHDRHDARDNLVERRYTGIRGEPVVHRGLGHAGRWMVYGSASNEEIRRVAFDLADRPVFGQQLGPDRQPFRWRRVGDRLLLAEGEEWKPVPGKRLDPARQARVRAAMTSFAMERRRSAEPALFQDARGVLVVEVAAGGPAERAGIRPGDILLRYAGAGLDRPEDLTALETTAAGPVAPLVLLRDGAHVTVQLGREAPGLVLEPQRN